MTAGIREIRPRLIHAIVLIVAVGAVLAARPPAAARVIIDNGTIQLGINSEGHLNVAPNVGPLGNNQPPPSFQSNADFVGLRLMSNNSEGTAPSCRCEGWGASGRIGSLDFQGGATTEGGVTNLLVEGNPTPSGIGTPDSGSSGDEFISVTTINGPSGSAALRVTHHYHPRSGTPNLYQVDVKIENISMSGDTVTHVRYRRIMDWDIAPTSFSISRDVVTIHVGDAANLIRATNDGFASPLPLEPPIITDPVLLPRPFTLVPGDPDRVRDGPQEQGALFDFGFGDLAPGAFKTFQIFYGATATEAAAIAAITTVGIEVYSLGQPNPGPDPDMGFPGTGLPLGEPNTFIFGFKAVGGTPAFTTDNSPPVAICKDGRVFTSPGTCEALTAAVISAVDGGSADPDPTDSITFALEPPGPFGPGMTTVTLTVTDLSNASHSCTTTVTVVDAEAPTITCPPPQSVECTGPNGATQSLTPSATDNCGILSVGCSTSGSTFPPGSTTVICSATDTSGLNSNSCNTTVTVVDRTPPTVSCVAVPVPRPKKHDGKDRDKHYRGRDEHHDGDNKQHRHADDKDHYDRTDHHRGDDKHHQDCDERRQGYDKNDRGRDDHHHDRDKPHHGDRKHDGYCDATGSFKVTASDLCGSVTITLGGVTLTNGEVIGIRRSHRPGVFPVPRSRREDDDHRQPPVKTFMAGPGPLVITATDGAGNSAEATCPLPPKEKEHDDRDSKKVKDRQPEDKDSRKGKKS